MKALLSSFTALFLGTGLCANHSTPQIEITSVPAYGSPGSIGGIVTGVDFATHRVAVYIHVEGSGWWTKPSFQSPTVAIQPDGTFSANVFGGGLDHLATLYCVQLVPAATTPPAASGAVSLPEGYGNLASDCAERYGRTLSFAGRTWAVKGATLPVGPGSNVFSDLAGDVWVDDDGLHMTIRFHGGQWWSTEVILLEDLGHGTYVFRTRGRSDVLDAGATWGFFTWDSFGGDPNIPSWPNREIDVEIGRWGNPADRNNAQVVVQPWWVPGSVVRYTIPSLAADDRLTHFFTWSDGRVDFTALTGHHAPSSYPPGSVIHTSTYVDDPGSNHVVPSPGRARVHANLWLNNVALGGPMPPVPQDGLEIELVLSDFEFLPLEPGVPSCFGVGCPCGNDAPLTGTGCANSTGTGGRLGGGGSTSVATDDLLLTATGLPPGNSGLYYMGDSVVSTPFFDGLQCALGTTFRFLCCIQSTGAGGTMTLGPGIAAASGGLITPGTTWYFHAWHRDAAPGPGPCGTGANLTNLYGVSFTP